MSPKDDYVWSFLTDLRHQRETMKRLRAMAQERPDLVDAYIKTLPENWEPRFDDEMVDLLKQLVRDAGLDQ